LAQRKNLVNKLREISQIFCGDIFMKFQMLLWKDL